MNTLSVLISLWKSPQQAVKKLTETFSLVRDLQIVFFLTVGILIQVGLFIWLVDVIPSSHFFSIKGIETIAYVSLGIAIGLYTYANIISLLTWKIASLLKGLGSLSATRTGILSSLICYLPFGLSLLFIYFAYSQKIEYPLLKFVSLLSLPITFFYGLIISIKIISAIHALSFFRSFLTIFISFIFQVVFLLGLSMLLR